MTDKTHLKVLIRRLGVTFLIIFVYVLGSHIALPFAAVTEQYKNMLASTSISIMSMISGANFMRLSLFSIGLNPFMIAMLVIQLLMVSKLFAFDALSMQQVEMSQQLMIFVFTLLQATVFTFSLDLGREISQKLMIILVLTAGSLLVTWLCFMNIKFGIGGTSPIILLNILTTSTPTLLDSLKKMSKLNHFGWYLGLLAVGSLFLIYFLLAFTHAYYPLATINTSLPSTSKPIIIPLGLNMGAMMTYMMGMAVLTTPALLSSFLGPDSIFNNSTFQAVVSAILSFVLFYFFTFMQFNPKDQAKMLRNSGCYIVGIRPNRPTQRYLSKILRIVTFPGALLTAFQLTLGLMGPRILGQYAGFAVLPMNAVMLTMFMNGIKDQVAILLFPHRYYKLQKEGY